MMKPVTVCDVSNFGSIIAIHAKDTDGLPVTIYGDARPMMHFLEDWKAAGEPEVIGYDADSQALSLEVSDDFDE